ncbi:MAG: chlorite dismutase family protein [Acidobacteria bacterium]|nr:chlorite dismutase family protein [Acidobacteriota bacterium]
MHTEERPEPERFAADVLEHGGPVRGQPQTLDRRLFFQLQVFTGSTDTVPLVRAVRESGLEAVVYADVNDPRGVGVLAMTEDPEVFAGAARSLFVGPAFGSLDPLPEFTMLGRTYATGREPDLEDYLLRKGRRNALNPEHRWAVWYPLRRLGAFNRLPRSEQGRIMAEHATIGRAYGEAGYAYDIRLECHGLDRHDNEFVLGIIGRDLVPLSKLIKDMRATRQTSEFMEKMGPFFVGRVLYQSALADDQRPPK